MTVVVTYRCGGCPAVETVQAREQVDVVRTFGGMDLVRKTRPTIARLAPPGWVAFDPYTGCCYCPRCWAGIQAPSTETADASA